MVPAHVSPTVHGSPSLQVPPVAVWLQPADLPHASTVQALASSHDPIFPAHMALAQLSFPVQALPSSQAAVLGLWTQPWSVLHRSSVQTFWSSQLTAGGGAEQAPARQVAGACQPVTGHEPAEQAVPSTTVACVQPVDALHPSVVHGLPSSQLGPPVPLQTAFTQLSSFVQLFPSSQVAATGRLTHPVCATQLSAVQGLPSAQLTVVPGTQTPSEQVSLAVHALPSLHGATLLA